VSDEAAEMELKDAALRARLREITFALLGEGEPL
jgi:hypothetical protein